MKNMLYEIGFAIVIVGSFVTLAGFIIMILSKV
jgi:hypothetical protein